ncbi:MAG: redoxin family protein [Opitutales bacterium]|jgi:protein SCO1/2|nr:redoxin family protein [Opitutales bacterium]MBT7867560.1 redoxin family protein [Opitutales bacterium]
MRSESRSISRANDRLKQILFVLWLTALVGCSQNNEGQEDENAPGYPLVGVIISVDEETRTLEVTHEDIPDFMPAMTMRFEVDPGDFDNARAGQNIRARLIRTEEGGFKLTRIWPLDEEAAKDLKKFNEQLQEQTDALDMGYYYGEGDTAPDFALLDQFGKTITSERFKGKPLYLNFIFTRCTDAHMCPLSTSKMALLQTMVAEAGLDVSFVSITMDPEFDTPGVLRQYAEVYGIDGDNFHFVTGPRPAVRNLIKSYGVTAIDNVDAVMHSLATVLIAEDGSIVKRSEKSAWSPDEFFEALKEADGAD